jgi:SAM-dependent methyltransferase
MPSAKVAEAWSIFWAEQGPASRCLANAPHELLEPLDRHWRNFASTLAPKSKVLDLGCGAGAVGRLLLAAEPRLQVTGIDFAKVPRSDDRRLELLPGIAMESLPLPDGFFGAAVSQFGYEYGATEQAAQEVARVLSPGAPLSLLIHHPESPLVAGMRLHRRAIQALCEAQVRSAFMSGDAKTLDQCIAAVKRECSDPIIDRAAHGLRLQIHQDQAGREAVWTAVEEALAPELVMLEALDRIDRPDLEYWTEPLAKAFEIGPPTIVRIVGREPVAWTIQGIRRT